MITLLSKSGQSAILTSLINYESRDEPAYTVAVKVVDNEGLESVEIFRLNVNGVVKKV